MNPPTGTGGSLSLKQTASCSTNLGHTFFGGALLHEPGSPDIVLGGKEAARFEEIRVGTSMESDSDNLLILACKHSRGDVQEEEMSENKLGKHRASTARAKAKAPSQQSSTAVEFIQSSE